MHATPRLFDEPRLPGDPEYVRRLWRGEVPLPAPTTARARWDARQAAVIAHWPLRARMLLGIIDQFVDEIGAERAQVWTLVQVRDAVAMMARNQSE